MTLSRSSKVIFADFESQIDFPLVFHGNHGSISELFAAGADVCCTERRVGFVARKRLGRCRRYLALDVPSWKLKLCQPANKS